MAVPSRRERRARTARETDDSRERARWLRAGMVLGASLIVVPVLAAFVTVFVASRGPEGLRGATHRPEMAGKVRLAYITVSAVAFSVPPGVLLLDTSVLALVEDRKRRPRDVAA